MQVRHILQNKGRDIIGVADSATLGEAAHILAEHHIGALLIQDSGGALAGIFSERDLVRAVAEDGPLALSRAIAAYMSRQVTTCHESDTVEDLMEMMTHGRFRHVPVLDEHHRLVRHDFHRRCGEDPHCRNPQRSQFPARLYFRRDLNWAIGNF